MNRLILAPLLLLGLAAYAQAMRQITLEEIAKHDTAKDCWMAIEDGVFDVTKFIKKHPGGKDAIVMGCGRSATVLFKNRPMGSGTNHSEEAYAMLGDYRIGDLVKTASPATPPPDPAPDPTPPPPAPTPAPQP